MYEDMSGNNKNPIGLNLLIIISIILISCLFSVPIALIFSYKDTKKIEIMAQTKNVTFEETKENLKDKNLDELLEEISVLDEWENDQSEILMKMGWFAVATDLGIVAYFGSEGDAYKFRLDYINRILNP